MLEIKYGLSFVGLQWWGHFNIFEVVHKLVTYMDLIVFKMLIELHIHFQIRRPS
jgi:hypothetical protein